MGDFVQGDIVWGILSGGYYLGGFYPTDIVWGDIGQGDFVQGGYVQYMGSVCCCVCLSSDNGTYCVHVKHVDTQIIGLQTEMAEHLNTCVPT